MYISYLHDKHNPKSIFSIEINYFSVDFYLSFSPRSLAC